MVIDTDFINGGLIRLPLVFVKHNPIYNMKEEFFYDEFLFGMF